MKIDFYEDFFNDEEPIRIYIDNKKCDFNSILDNMPNNNELIKELDKIMNFANEFNNDYINSDTWFKYQIVKQIEIPAISKKILFKKNSFNSNDNKVQLSYKSNKRFDNITFNKGKLFHKSLKYKNLLINDNDNIFSLNIKKTATFNNNIELLYIFLEILFSLQKTYCIKKCNYCKKYYLAVKTNTNYCNRTFYIGKKLTPCSLIKSTLEKDNIYQKFRKQEKIFLGVLDSSKTTYAMEYTNNYKKYAKTVKDKCFKNRDLTPLKTLINDYKIKHPFKN